MVSNKLKELIRTEKQENGKKPSPWLIGGIILSILFLAGSSLFDAKPEKEEHTKTESAYDESYTVYLEKRLTETLKTIDQAGDVRVFITMESGGEKVLATDIHTESEEAALNEETQRSDKREESVIFGKGDNGQSPYIIKEKTPQPSGVLVVATGARAESVRMEIYEAVRALFGLSPHRIKVTY